MTSFLRSKKHLYVPASEVVSGNKGSSTLVPEEFSMTSYVPLINLSIDKFFENPTRPSKRSTVHKRKNGLLSAPVPLVVKITVESGISTKKEIII